MFQTQFFNGFHSTKYNLIYYQVPYYICFTANKKKKKQP